MISEKRRGCEEKEQKLKNERNGRGKAARWADSAGAFRLQPPCRRSWLHVIITSPPTCRNHCLLGCYANSSTELSRTSVSRMIQLLNHCTRDSLSTIHCAEEPTDTKSGVSSAEKQLVALEQVIIGQLYEKDTVSYDFAGKYTGGIPK